MIRKIVHLKFHTPLHLANASADYLHSYRLLHSDTLYSALIQAWAIRGESAVLERINQAKGLPTFTLSSLFPYTTLDDVAQKIYFLPRFAKKFNDDSLESIDKKQLKKIEWLDASIFYQQQQSLNGSAFQVQSLKGIYMTNAAIKENFLEAEIQPHVVVSRDNVGATPYYLERLRFKSNSGLYGIYEGSEADLEAVQLGLELLETEGIGTDRNTGNGKFTLEITDLPMEIQQILDYKGGNHGVNLSLFCPEGDTYEAQLAAFLDSPSVAYELVRRGGWITTEGYLSLKKKDIHMFKEGSIWKTTASPHGKSVNLRPYILSVDASYSNKPYFPIWRVGKSLFVHVKF